MWDSWKNSFSLLTNTLHTSRNKTFALIKWLLKNIYTYIECFISLYSHGRSFFHQEQSLVQSWKSWINESQMAGCRMWECWMWTPEYDCLKRENKWLQCRQWRWRGGIASSEERIKEEGKLKGSKSNGLAGYELYDNLWVGVDGVRVDR